MYRAAFISNETKGLSKAHQPGWVPVQGNDMSQYKHRRERRTFPTITNRREGSTRGAAIESDVTEISLAHRAIQTARKQAYSGTFCFSKSQTAMAGGWYWVCTILRKYRISLAPTCRPATPEHGVRPFLIFPF
jgi:hypothetical protein